MWAIHVDADEWRADIGASFGPAAASPLTRVIRSFTLK
jgi:hypothetical protein